LRFSQDAQGEGRADKPAGHTGNTARAAGWCGRPVDRTARPDRLSVTFRENRTEEMQRWKEAPACDAASPAARKDVLSEGKTIDAHGRS